MTKCTFCVDELEAGGSPACVTACPLRVLDFGTLDELEARYGPGATPPPLPDPSLTEPGLVVTPHGATAGDEAPRVGNREEVVA